MWYATFVLACLAPLATGVVYDAIVVGLGTSGVAALSRLSEKGYKVLGLEAKSRIGGRVNTQEFGGGIVELGAEWIHGEVGNEVYSLARENNVAIFDYKWRIRAADAGGHDESTLVALFGFCFNSTENTAEEEKDDILGDYVEKRFREHIANTSLSSDEDFCSNFLRSVELALATADGFDSWQEMTMRTRDQFHNCPGSLGWSWRDIGYNTLFDILLHKYNNGTGLPLEMKLDSEVTSIDSSNVDNVTVVAGGDTYVAKTVIVTVSLGVLQHSHKKLFAPPLPLEKQQAIEVLKIGAVDKICLHYEVQWWEHPNDYYFFIWTDEARKNVSSEDWWTTQISGYSVTLSNPHVLTLWITGEGARAMERVDEQAVLERAEDVLGMFFDNVPRAKNMTRTRWYSDPHTRGSYSYHAAPTSASAVKVLSEPLGRLHWAGEATHPHHFSTVHGALDSGWREADNVHALLTGSQ